MQKATFTDRLRYAFDNTMSKGTAALVGWLGILSLVLIVIFSLLVTATGVAPIDEAGAKPTFFQIAWMGLMRTLDAGTMGGDTGSWPYLFAMFGVTLGGIFIISTLIGVLTTGVEARLEELRKGRSRVIETGHTVILGWSPQVFSIIPELVVANANQPRSCIVVLGNADKVEMESEIQQRVGNTGRTRIVCRTGNPAEMADLEIANVHAARAIIVVSPEDDDPDSLVIKTMLAITHNPHRRTEPYHIVAELHDPKNLEVARLVGRDEVELVLSGDLTSRIVAQTCRQSGLSIVYTELLDFGGDEIYFKHEPGLAGRSFGETLLAYEDSAVIGICPQGGCAHLNPPMSTIIQPGDQIIAISADDDTIRLSTGERPEIQESLIQHGSTTATAPERTLLLGWNWHAPAIINELDRYVAPGSTITVVADATEAEEELGRSCGNLCNETLKLINDDTTNRRTLNALHIDTYDHVIVLSYSDTLDMQAADARTLITLLHLRDIAEHTSHPFSIVSEMLDVRNRNLAEVTHADDFVVSDKLISLTLSQVAENKALNAVLTDIFDADGSEIYIKPAENYVQLGQSVNFYTIVAAAAARGEIAFGYRLQALAGDADKSYGIVINPNKSTPLTLSTQDRIIVVAES